MRITVTGHSVSHVRQTMFFKTVADMDNNVQVIGPTHWGSERYRPHESTNYAHVCLEPFGRNMLNFTLRGLEGNIGDFEPDILYIMEEPYTILAAECIHIAEKKDIPTALFTWENVVNRDFGTQRDQLERDVLSKTDILIAGNNGAMKRLIYKGVDEDRITVCPQVGIDTARFQQDSSIAKEYDFGYFGRLVKEKGIESIENAARYLNKSILWVGGRGDMTPTYGDYIGWQDYPKLPEYYNKIGCFVHFPYAHNGYSEQFAYTLGEAMACGVPVISSRNGSIADVYEGAPIFFVEEGNEKLLRNAMDYSVVNPPWWGWKRDARNWVKANLSNPVIAKRLLDILERQR